MVQEAVEPLFCASTLSAQGGVRTIVYDAVEHVITDQIKTVLLGDTINNHVAKFFEAGKTSKGLGKGLLCYDKFLAPKLSIVQTQTMEAITDQQSLDVLGSMSMAVSAKKDVDVAAEHSLAHNALPRTSSESSIEESCKRSKSGRARNHTRCCTR